MQALKDDLFDGDVILTNHPLCGGSHLPDLTVITPVFVHNNPQPVFFVASRFVCDKATEFKELKNYKKVPETSTAETPV